MSVLTLDPFEHEQRRERTLWTIAALVVAGLHVGLAVGYLLLRPAPQGRAQAPAFDVVFTPAVVSEPAPTAQEVPASEPTPVEPPKEEPVKDEPVAREAVAEPVPPAPSEPEPQVMAQPVPDAIASPEPAPQVALAPRAAARGRCRFAAAATAETDRGETAGDEVHSRARACRAQAGGEEGNEREGRAEARTAEAGAGGSAFACRVGAQSR
ncbi:hypothetical protein ACRAVF_18110 [Bradyrhizobium oligotrophicum S58]